MSDTLTRSDRLKAAHDLLQEAVESIVSGDDWKRMLQVASKFHRYSFNNHAFRIEGDGFVDWVTFIARS